MRSFAIFAPLLALTAVQCVALAVYVAAGVPPSPAMSLISSMSMALFLLFWIIADARYRRCVPCHDFGFLVGVFLPISLIWYVLWTRGWRGIALLVGLVGLAYLPRISAAIAWLVLHGAA